MLKPDGGGRLVRWRSNMPRAPAVNGLRPGLEGGAFSRVGLNSGVGTMDGAAW